MKKKLISISAILASLALFGAGCGGSSYLDLSLPKAETEGSVEVQGDSSEKINQDLEEIQVEGSLEGEFKDVDSDAESL